MRVLHTSDWHLGQKFIAQSRDAEQALALDWLLAQIVRLQVDLLIVAGDIFDVHNPPLTAEDLYYNFLTRLRDTPCRHVIIIGGNHDSAPKLNAPKGLLRALNIHVVGAAGEDRQDELVPLYAPDGSLEAIVAAVPFLRDRDFRFTTVGESTEARIRRIKEGIAEHYQAVAELALATTGGQKNPACCYIATGHLYATGASATEEQQNIYLGDMDNIAAEQLPDLFDYIALGHIHRAQIVGKKPHIRYCGSLIPLSFSELSDQKQVLTFEFTPNKGIGTVESIVVPVFRQLKTIRGSMEELKLALSSLHVPDTELPAWADLLLEDASDATHPEHDLREWVQHKRIEILKIRYARKRAALDEVVVVEDLTQLSPAEVFVQRCAAEGMDETRTHEMRLLFDELQAWAEAHPDKIR